MQNAGLVDGSDMTETLRLENAGDDRSAAVPDQFSEKSSEVRGIGDRNETQGLGGLWSR